MMRITSYHPVICVGYICGALAGTILFRHPVYLLISLLAVWSMSLMLQGRKALLRNMVCHLLGILWGIWYQAVHHFGVTVLGYNRIGNAYTKEALLYGILMGQVLAAVLMWLAVMHEVITTDMIVYLFGRISPALGLFCSRFLRMTPRTGKQAEKMRTARSGIGSSSDPVNGGRSRFKEWAMLFTWTAENLADSTESMKSRGYGAERRTAYSIYRFDHRDRALVLMMAFLMVVLGIGYRLDQMTALFDPRIVLSPFTGGSVLFYLAYVLLLFWPHLFREN